VLWQEAVELVRNLHADPSVTIHPQPNQMSLSDTSTVQVAVVDGSFIVWNLINF
jgi:hypothetical protein